jgi:hypothetical protein
MPCFLTARHAGRHELSGLDRRLKATHGVMSNLAHFTAAKPCHREALGGRLTASTGIKSDHSGARRCGRAEKEEHDAMRMDEVSINDYARQLLEAHGDNALAEVAQRALACEQRGETEQAETWRHVEAALKLMRGSNVS